MRKLLVLASFVLVLAVSGCGSSPDGRVKDQIKAMNALAEAIEKKEPQDKIAERKKDLEEASKKCQDMGCTPEEFQKVMEDNKDELAKATQRLFQASAAMAFGDFKIPGAGTNNLGGGGAKSPAAGVPGGGKRK
jgi:hypothetical protein